MSSTQPDRAALDAAWQRANERRAFWDAHRAELTKRYPDQFVAVAGGEAVDHDPDLMALVQRLRVAGRDVRDVRIEFLATSRQKLAL